MKDVDETEEAIVDENGIFEGLLKEYPNALMNTIRCRQDTRNLEQMCLWSPLIRWIQEILADHLNLFFKKLNTGPLYITKYPLSTKSIKCSFFFLIDTQKKALRQGFQTFLSLGSPL